MPVEQTFSMREKINALVMSCWLFYLPKQLKKTCLAE